MGLMSSAFPISGLLVFGTITSLFAKIGAFMTMMPLEYMAR